MRLLTALLIGCVALSLAAAASAVFAQQDAAAERARLQHNIQVATSAASTFNKQASEAGPSESSDQQKRVYAEQTGFLRRGASQISALTEKARVAIRNAKADAGQMAAMNMQFLALQNALQNESRKFAKFSQASRSRHEVAMNSIQNIK